MRRPTRRPPSFRTSRTPWAPSALAILSAALIAHPAAANQDCSIGRDGWDDIQQFRRCLEEYHPDRWGDAWLLHRASRLTGNPTIVRLLLQEGWDPNAPDNDGQTPLHEGARNSNPTVVSHLLDAGAELNARDNEGYTLGWGEGETDWISAVHETGVPPSIEKMRCAGRALCLEKRAMTTRTKNGNGSLGRWWTRVLGKKPPVGGDPMQNKTLIVPGTKATTLIDRENNTVYNPLKLKMKHLFFGDQQINNNGRTPEQLGALFSMKHTRGRLPPTATSLEASTELVPGKVVRTPYNKLPVDEYFPYDWRADLRFNAKRLLRHLRADPEVRWNLIGHSQGGLLIVLASKLADYRRDFASMVRRVVLVGCPLAGTVQAVDAMVFGRKDLGVPAKSHLMMAARTWPALYQLFPAWPAAVANGRLCPGDKQFVWPGAWDDYYEGMQSDLLERARDTQILLAKPFTHLEPEVKTLTIMGWDQDTPVNVPLGKDGYLDRYVNEPGDGFVPEEITRIHIEGTASDVVEVKTYEGVYEHGLLCDHHEVVDEIGNFLNSK